MEWILILIVFLTGFTGLTGLTGYFPVSGKNRERSIHPAAESLPLLFRKLLIFLSKDKAEELISWNTTRI
jgi:hypothetical protein